MQIQNTFCVFGELYLRKHWKTIHFGGNIFDYIFEDPTGRIETEQSVTITSPEVITSNYEPVKQGNININLVFDDKYDAVKEATLVNIDKAMLFSCLSSYVFSS